MGTKPFLTDKVFYYLLLQCFHFRFVSTRTNSVLPHLHIGREHTIKHLIRMIEISEMLNEGTLRSGHTRLASKLRIVVTIAFIMASFLKLDPFGYVLVKFSPWHFSSGSNFLRLHAQKEPWVSTTALLFMLPLTNARFDLFSSFIINYKNRRAEGAMA